LAVADEVFRAVKFMAGVMLLCVTQMLIATGPVGHTMGAWVAVGGLTVAEVVLVLLGMVRWPPR
jgi:hypothetical protein